MIEDTSTFRSSYDTEDETTSLTFPLTYHVNNSYIFTKFNEGTVVLEYLAFPSDENGLPVIIDDVRYIKGIKTYVAERIGSYLWMSGKLSDKIYNKLEQDWSFYVNSAATSLRVKGVDGMESLKNIMARMISNSHHHDYQFKYRANKEALNIR